MARRQKGYTLVELMVVMVIFVIVIMITGTVFNSLLKSTVKTSKSVETQITDIIGLEVMRVDIKHAGHGLPYYFDPLSHVKYDEAPNANITVAVGPPAVNVNPSNYNDGNGAAVDGNPPWPYRLGNNVGVNGSDYLVVKSTLLGTGTTAQKWNYIPTGGTLKAWDVAAQNLATNGENVIVVDPAPNASPDQQRQLITSSTNSSFYAKFNTAGDHDLLTKFIPTEANDTYLVYGIADATVATPRMPFNRADYYIRIPTASSLPQRCAPGTGILYKATLNQDGTFTEIPLLDCVGDMQFIFSLANGAPSDNTVGTHVDNLGTADTDSLYKLTSRVKEVRLYVLTHEGRMDPKYTYPANPINVGEVFGGTMLGSTWTSDGSGSTKNMSTTFTNWQNYYWKVLRVVIIPSNL
jgi:prepilin-type N-terminal cleavage/methylation domain-containing protein